MDYIVIVICFAIMCEWPFLGIKLEKHRCTVQKGRRFYGLMGVSNVAVGMVAAHIFASFFRGKIIPSEFFFIWVGFWASIIIIVTGMFCVFKMITCDWS